MEENLHPFCGNGVIVHNAIDGIISQNMPEDIYNALHDAALGIFLDGPAFLPFIVSGFYDIHIPGKPWISHATGAGTQKAIPASIAVDMKAAEISPCALYIGSRPFIELLQAAKLHHFSAAIPAIMDLLELSSYFGFGMVAVFVYAIFFDNSAVSSDNDSSMLVSVFSIFVRNRFTG